MKTAARARNARRKTLSAPSQRVTALPRPEAWREVALHLGPLLFLSLVMRLYGIGFGAGYHPDERHTVDVVLGLHWTSLNPRSFAYGSFPFYCVFLVNQLIHPFQAANYDKLFFISRACSALVGTIGIAATYFLGRALDFRRELAWLGAAMLALTFFHVQNSHFFTVDVWLTTACTLALIALLRFERADDRATALVAGAAIGITTAIKISGISLLLPLAAVVAWRRYQRRDYTRPSAWQPLGWALLAVLVAFTISEPFAFLDFGRAWSNLSEQMAMASGAAIRPFTLQYLHTQPWLYPLKQILVYTVGWPLAVTMLVGCLLAFLNQFRRFDARQAVVQVWAITFFIVLGAEHTKFPRYLLPVYPVMALYGAFALGELESWLEKRARRHFLPSGWVWVPRGAVLSAAAVFTIAHLQAYSQPSTWLTASAWIAHEYPHGARMVTEAWDDSLPTGYDLRDFINAGTLPLYEAENDARLDQMVKILENGELMALPTARVYGSILQAEERYPQTARYYRLLFAGRLGYERVRTFKLRPHFGPWEWNDELGDESLSVYTNPKVVIFRNRDHLPAAELRARIAGHDNDGGATRAALMTVREQWE